VRLHLFGYVDIRGDGEHRDRIRHMDQQEIQNEIARRRERARTLDSDRLIHEMFYKLELMRDWDRYPLISSAEPPKSDYREKVLAVVLCDKIFLFSQRQTDSEVGFLSITVSGSKVFEVATASHFHVGTSRVTSFIEGAWIEDVKTLHSQMQAVAEKGRVERQARLLIDEAKRFGIAPKQVLDK
jgi:hypothetical protein